MAHNNVLEFSIEPAASVIVNKVVDYWEGRVRRFMLIDGLTYEQALKALKREIETE